MISFSFFSSFILTPYCSLSVFMKSSWVVVFFYIKPSTSQSHDRIKMNNNNNTNDKNDQKCQDPSSNSNSNFIVSKKIITLSSVWESALVVLHILILDLFIYRINIVFIYQHFHSRFGCLRDESDKRRRKNEKNKTQTYAQ